MREALVKQGREKEANIAFCSWMSINPSLNKYNEESIRGVQLSNNMIPKQQANCGNNHKSNEIIAAGIPSSGSTMMYQVLATLFPSIRITKTHDFIKEANAKIVVTYRDFRDVAVSLARVVRSQKKQPYQDKITRKELESSIKTILQRIDVLDNYNTVALASKKVILMRYELFLKNYKYIFQQLSDFFEIKIDKATQLKVIETTSIENNLKISSKFPDFSYYDLESRIHGDHIYDGRVGGWVRFVNPEDYDLIYSLLGDALARYNYIPVNHPYFTRFKEDKNQAINLRFYSQYQQDKFLWKSFFFNKTNGFFVEVGADNGLTNSNTAFFEKTLSWQGICIEPKPSVFPELCKNRGCLCENVAISNNTQTEVRFLEIYGYGRQLSGIVGKYDPRHLDRIESEKKNSKCLGSKEILVKAVTLENLLNKYNFNHIDLLSIDTEGGEVDILNSIDFSKVSVDVIIVENNYKDNYVEQVSVLKKDYVLYHRIASDEIYISRRFANYLISNSKPDVSIKTCRQLIKNNPNFPWHYYRLGRILVNLSCLEEAEEVFTQAINLFSNFAWLHQGMGEIMETRGKLDEAAKWYQKAVNLNPNSSYFNQILSKTKQ